MKNPKKILLPLAGALCLSATLSSALAAAFPVTLHNLTPSQREALRGQGQVGTAYLSQNNETGTNGSLWAPFTAQAASSVFVLTTAPGAENYNVQLYQGMPGEGKAASDYTVSPVNGGVCFTGLEPGKTYYMKISSSTLRSSGCTVTYELLNDLHWAADGQ